MKQILVIGSSNTDMIVKVPRIPNPGETISGGSFMIAAGGKGANQAVAAARCGGKVTFMGELGEDQFGKEVINNLKEDNINTEHLYFDRQKASGIALIMVSETGENSIAVAPGANHSLTAEKILKKRKVIEEADLILLQLEVPVEAVQEAARIARAAGVLVVLNPAPALELPESFYQYVDFITPNEYEAAVLSGVQINEPEFKIKAAEKLLQKGVRQVIITMGDKGAFYMNETEFFDIPGFSVEASDTTGAGDTFNGALCVALTEGRSLKEAIVFAHAAAALSVQKMGAQPSIPYRSDIEHFLSLMQ